MVRKINAKSFKPYGRVIEYPAKASRSKKINLFRIVVQEPEPSGWRIACLVVRDKAINKLERHFASYESFEPMAGEAILYVANARNPAKIESFLLNKPVILNKGVWHGVVTLGSESEIKITENARVSCDYWRLVWGLTP